MGVKGVGRGEKELGGGRWRGGEEQQKEALSLRGQKSLCNLLCLIG